MGCIIMFFLWPLYSQGEEAALTPLYLGSLYDGLDESVYSIFRLVDDYDVVTYANTVFLQMFL